MWHEIYIGVLSKMRYQLQDMPPVSGRIQFGQFPKKKKKEPTTEVPRIKANTWVTLRTSMPDYGGTTRCSFYQLKIFC